MSIFNFRAEVQSAGQGNFAVFSSEFGDGYSQDVPAGINNERQQWTVVVSGKGPYIREVLNFIRNEKGMPFQWRAPNTTGLGWYKCNSYSQSDQGGDYWTLTMQFQQAFKP